MKIYEVYTYYKRTKNEQTRRTKIAQPRTKMKQNLVQGSRWRCWWWWRWSREKYHSPKKDLVRIDIRRIPKLQWHIHPDVLELCSCMLNTWKIQNTQARNILSSFEVFFLLFFHFIFGNLQQQTYVLNATTSSQSYGKCENNAINASRSTNTDYVLLLRRRMPKIMHEKKLKQKP